ncbi:hypothetical protein PAECIP111890_01924 [Paenibacillus sp. JJ-223]|nr:hypothetical protein PAECIP111890_01924 [Paenibacillus sp. JJ-223]
MLWITERLFSLWISDMIVSRKKKERLWVEMAMLSDEMLLDSYHQAIELNLERDFIALLLAEIHKRKLDTNASAILH